MEAPAENGEWPKSMLLLKVKTRDSMWLESLGFNISIAAQQYIVLSVSWW